MGVVKFFHQNERFYRSEKKLNGLPRARFECKHPAFPFTVVWSNFQLFFERSAFTTGFTFVHIGTPWLRVRYLYHPGGYRPEPQLNREEILGAVTDFIFDRTQSHTHSHSLTSGSSGSHRSNSLVDTGYGSHIGLGVVDGN